jgi:N-methylhydantoinase A
VRVVGIDVGGTFTDLVLFDQEGHDLWRHKTLSTPSDPGRGALGGLRELLELSGTKPDDVAEVTYATTVATNAVLQRRGPRVGLITTKGFRDVILIGRQDRHDLFDLFIRKQTPMLNRRDIVTVDERMKADGTFARPLDRDEARTVARNLHEEGYESVAVCFLHAYANPQHEREMLEILAAENPDWHCCGSHEVAPVIREYERTNTTVVNAYVKPPVTAHLDGMERGMREAGITAPFNVMLSDASIRSHRKAAQQPVRLIESGPAAAAQAAAFVAGLGGEGQLIAFDMGGTTAKVALIEGGEVALADEFEVDRQDMMPRSGLPLAIPCVDLVEIGSGGGSIAHTEMGSIRVGPESGGADPGPACYGGGGDRPTVTDADLVLGYLDPDYFLGGRMALDVEAAEAAIERDVGSPLDLPVERAAIGIFEVVNAAMQRAILGATTQRGRDQRQYTLVATGGAGPVHALALARSLGIPRVLVPALSGVASAMGMLAADRRVSMTHTAVHEMDESFSDHAQEEFDRLREEAVAELRASVRGADDVSVRYRVDLRMVGQGFELSVDVPDGPVDSEALLERFHERYVQLYSQTDTAAPVEATTWRVDAIASPPSIPLNQTEHLGVAAEAKTWRRSLYDPGLGSFVDADVVHYDHLVAMGELQGPAVVTMRDSTLVVFSGDALSIDRAGNVIIDVGGAK